MSRVDERWFRNEGVACLFTSGLLAGNQVPGGAQGLRMSDGDQLIPAGSPIDGDAILVRERELEVELTVDGLRDRDGTPGTLRATVVLEPPASRTAILLLRDAFLRERGQIEATDLAPYLAQRVRPGILRVLVERPWDGEGGFVPRLRKGEFLPALLKEPLFEVGLSLLRVLTADVESEPLAESRERRSELRREAERVRARLEFLELWKREEMGDALAREEVERMASHLRRQGSLRQMEDRKELSEKQRATELAEAEARGKLRRMLERERLAVRMEIDEEKLEYEIARARKLKSALEEAGLLGAIDGVADPTSKERLIQLLIEKEMTPDQIAARARVQGVQDLERRFDTFAEELRAELRGGRVPPWASQLPKLSRIWLAAGLSLYRIDADAAFSGGDPTPVLPPEDIGYLRSVSLLQNGRDTSVLVGAQSGVAVYDPQQSRWTVLRYRRPPRGRGGANAVVRVGDRVLATHSEMGFHQWGIRDESVCDGLFVDRIVPGVSTRGACLGPQQRIYFSHGADMYSVPGEAPDSELRHHGTLPESVTAIGATSERLVAGTRDGHLHQWTESDRWLELPFETRGPIFKIGSPGDGDDVGWIVGARECAVHILDAAGNRIGDYRSRYPIRWTAAGQQGVLGVDRFGQHLLLWSWGDPRSPLRRIRIPDQIQYLAVERVGPEAVT